MGIPCNYNIRTTVVVAVRAAHQGLRINRQALKIQSSALPLLRSARNWNCLPNDITLDDITSFVN